MNTTTGRLLACLASFAAPAGAAAAPTVSAAWVRATPPGASTAAAYFTISNGGAADRLIGAESPAARELQLHAQVDENGLRHMRQLADIPLPAGATVRLTAGGLHVMLVDIAAPLKPGDHVAITLHFANAADIELQVPVQDGRALTEHH